MGPRRARLLVGLLYLALFVVVVALDVSAAEGQAWLQQAGGWGLLAFVIAFALLQPLGMASHVFVVAAALVWSPWIALSTSWVGAIAAGCVAFGFSRFVGREFVQRRLPDKLRPWDERLATRGFRTVLTMRLLLFTFGPMQLMFGVSRVRFASFVAGTALGLLPMLMVETFVGGSVVEWIWPGAGPQTATVPVPVGP